MALANDKDFLKQLNENLVARRTYLEKSTWYTDNFPNNALGGIAYFSMEFGLSEALPIYSGGLGVLAGDHLKTASDLGLPLIGVGLLYQQGYFRQSIDSNGEQLAFFPYNDPAMLPVIPLRNADGEWLQITVELPGRCVQLRGWQAQIGRVMLYLLDSNDPLNIPSDRGITSDLYRGGAELRLQQEIILGIGGWRLLRLLDIDCKICHLNEGHTAFAALERAREFMEKEKVPFSVAWRCTRAGNVFTTHTPVAAGFDRFPPELIAQYFINYVQFLGITMKELLALGRSDATNNHEPFNMAYLALHVSGRVNGVSRLHGEVSRHIFQPLYPRWPPQEVPVGHVTNGVHMPSWDSKAADELWAHACGQDRWLGELKDLTQTMSEVDDQHLWTLRSCNRQDLLEAVNYRLQHQQIAYSRESTTHLECGKLLDPNTLTLGLARRFVAYKRPNLLLHDPDRLSRLLNAPHYPVQLIIAGKAHPQDTEGQHLVQEWVRYLRRSDICGRAVFLEDYDLALAAELVQGVDVWLNTPRRPWEASGTSGMKVLVNGGLNLSELDGWWAEAYQPSYGWALGDGREHGSDPSWDAAEAEALYTLLEQQIAPCFYDRDQYGIPRNWVMRIRESMARLTPHYSSNRMLREYVCNYYLPSAVAYCHRSAEHGKVGTCIERWHQTLTAHWSHIHFGAIEIHQAGANYTFEVQVYLGSLDPNTIRVELYAEPLANEPLAPIAMQREQALVGAVNGYLYNATVSSARPSSDYTPRIIPYHPDSAVPLEVPFILWAR
jgi:starch phosphorylase